MKARGLNYWLVLTIAVATIGSGLVQCLDPGFVLGLISGESTATSRHFFGIVGMFMVLFGGALFHALRASTPQPVVVFWTALQKFGASAAVGLGVHRQIFSALALLVACFDFVSGLLIGSYWLSLRKSDQAVKTGL